MKSIFCIIILATRIVFSSDFEKNTGAIVNDPKILWGKTPSDSLVQPMMNQYVVNEIIKVRPVAGHHFNLKAFNSCQGKKPLKVSESEMECQFSEAGKYKINIYICDDKNTFCKIQFFHVVVTAPRGYKSALKKHVSSNILFIPKAEFKVPDSFIKNKVDYAVQKSKKENKPLFIVFSAHWCPSCNLLNENVLSKPEFLKSSENIVKLILDVDSDISWELKEKFKVGGYPTTILATPQLHEIYRFVGYRSLQSTQKWLQMALKDKAEPVDMVISKILHMKDTKDDPQFRKEYEEKVMRVARWHVDREEYKEAKHYFSQIDRADAKMMSLVMDLKTANKKESERILNVLIKTYSKDVRLADWLMQISELKGMEVQKLILEYSSQALKWMNDSNIEDSGYTRADIFYFLGEAYGFVELSEESKEFYRNCAKEYGVLAKESEGKNPRGALMERAFCLAKSDNTTEALDIFKQLSVTYKNEFAFNYYYARALQQTLKTKEALVYATRAYDNSYGDNLIRAATLKAQMELDLKDIVNAEKTASKALEKIYLPENLSIRSHKYVQNLRQVLERIQYIKTGRAEGL